MGKQISHEGYFRDIFIELICAQDMILWLSVGDVLRAETENETLGE
jgi:hypothetical protein